jgi:hypothetical protein
MLRSALLLVASTALLALASTSPGAATDGLPTTCVIDGMVFDECPLGEDGPPWNGSGSGNLLLTKPDLGARGGGFAVAPSCLSQGRPFQAHAVIENFGGLDFAGNHLVRVDFYLVTPNTVAFPAANLLGSTSIVFPDVTSASLGEVGVLVTLDGNLPALAAGQYKLGIEIDVDDEVSELVESNNKVVAGDVVAVGDCVDLVPALDGTSVSSPVTQGETLGIAGSVRNEGEAALAGPRSIVVRYRAVPEGGDELGGTVLGEVTVALDAGSSLAPGAARMAPPLSVETELPPGNYAIGADVDFGGTGDEEGAVDEVDESNNSALVGSVEVNARPPGKPDYVVTKAQITGQEKDPLSAGFRFNVAIRLGNLGDNAQPGFYPEVRVVASRDQVIDSSDATLRDFPSARRVFSFGPGSALSRLVTLEVAWPAELPGGKYVIGVVVDPHNQVAEQREDNNVAIAGGVRAVIDCPHLATLEDAQAVYGEIFTRAAPLPVEPATHPGLDGELCEECFTCDLAIFTTELDVCHFDFRYKLANTHVEFFLRPMMHQACVTNLAGLVAARPDVVLDIYADAKKFKDGLASDKAFCDSHNADSVERRYCGCSNTNYLDWAPSPHPGQCVYSP